MKKTTKILLIITGCLLSACNYESSTEQKGSSSMTSQPTPPTYDIQTHCVGRFLIDVPATFTSSNMRSSLSSVGHQYLGENISTESLKELITERVESIKAFEKPEWGPSALLWAKEIEGIYVIAYNDNIPFGGGGFYEAYFQRSDHSYKTTIIFTEGKEQHYLEELLSISKNIYSNSNATVRKKEGACIADGYYQGPLLPSEYHTLTFIAKDAPDQSVTLKLDIRQGSNVNSWPYNEKMKPTGKRRIAGYPGKELLHKEDGNHKRDSFWAFLLWGGKLSENGTMGISLNLRFKRNYDYSYTTPYDFESSRHIWNQVANSVRLSNRKQD